MAELILTDEERNSASYLDFDDAALANLVRASALVIGEGKEGQRAVTVSTIACLLVKKCIEAGSEYSTIDLRGVTVPENVGDWIITIEKVNDEDC